jgi:selenium metabolism protein YedF
VTIHVVDARGQLCPRPLILTKKALNDPNVKDEFVLLIDNETARENVERLLKDNSVRFQTTKKEDHFQVQISKTGAPITADAEAYCAIEPEKKKAGHNLICIKNNKMGFGNDDLGAILLKAFINTIKEVKPLPGKIVFYNSGVMLTAANSALLAPLKELESLGVELLICGTCADFYKIKDQIGVGKISNMYTILESLTKAGSIIYP